MFEAKTEKCKASKISISDTTWLHVGDVIQMTRPRKTLLQMVIIWLTFWKKRETGRMVIVDVGQSWLMVEPEVK